jgi:hypothetical protein
MEWRKVINKYYIDAYVYTHLLIREYHRLDSPETDTKEEFGVQDIIRAQASERKRKKVGQGRSQVARSLSQPHGEFQRHSGLVELSEMAVLSSSCLSVPGYRLPQKGVTFSKAPLSSKKALSS